MDRNRLHALGTEWSGLAPLFALDLSDDESMIRDHDPAWTVATMGAVDSRLDSRAAVSAAIRSGALGAAAGLLAALVAAVLAA